MASSRGKGKTRAAANARGTPSLSRRSTRRTKDAAPDVYGDMLAEAAVTDPVEDTNRPLKRRRILREVSIPKYKEPSSDKGKRPATSPTTDGGNKAGQASKPAGSAGRGVQTIEASSDEEDESDFGFEDVDLDQPASSTQATQQEEGIAGVSISLDSQITLKRRAQARRKPASAAEKAHRLLVHKAHVLCLLGHCIYINSWCNNEVVQRNLQPLMTAKLKTYLKPKTTDSQFVRNRSFMDGLQQACEVFRDRFNVTASGSRRAQWSTEGQQNADAQVDVEPMDRSDFIKAAKKMEGSQDTGNQLFCAMLRAAGVETRLVCSLQPLPCTSTSAKPTTTPQKSVKRTVLAIASDTDPDKSEASADDASVNTSRSIGKIPSARRRLGQPSFAATSTAPSPTPREKNKPVPKLFYPVFWVEAFNAASQKWITIDPVVTGTVNKPSKLEPPSSYEVNQLSYAIVFERDGVAKDVTKRYAKAYNAKTRRQRVEATENGTTWFKKAMRIFRRRGGKLDRDQVEDAELAQKEAREGLPSNVQDFKDHPYYALERHVKRHEVIHPRREVGKVNAGTAAKPRMEAVFRRQDVLVCRSADKWYRLGREVKAGEQPLKHVVARSLGKRARSPENDGDGGEEQKTTALYAPYQTNTYVPPPVVKGHVPRNAYGNLDIYVPSMVPVGGVHIRHPLTAQAARLLKVDYADAVTGFQFKGRQGTAVVEGAVVAEQYGDAVRAAIEGFEHEKEEEVSMQRSLQALRLWKRFLTGLRIAERVAGYGDTSSAAKGKKVKQQMDEAEDEDDRIEDAGGFLPEEGPDEGTALPTAGRFSLEELIAPTKKAVTRKKRKVEESEEEEFVEAEDEGEEAMERGYVGGPDEDYGGEGGEGGGFFVEDEMGRGGEGEGGGFVVDEGDSGGGFVVDDDDGGGGFMQEDVLERDGGGGGGFAPEDGGDDGASGFLPDEAESHDTEADVVRHEGDGQTSGRLESDNAAGSVPDQTQQHAALADPAAVDDKMDDGLFAAGHGDSPLTRPIPTDGDSVDGTSAAAGHHTREAGGGLTGIMGAGDAEAEGDESDRGSMLSHDPEDEDAEPDWLDSD